MNDSGPENARLRQQLNELRLEHRDLDVSIEQLDAIAIEDALLLRRMKKRKLALKDRIATLERLIDPGDLA